MKNNTIIVNFINIDDWEKYLTVRNDEILWMDTWQRSYELQHWREHGGEQQDLQEGQ